MKTIKSKKSKKPKKNDFEDLFDEVIKLDDNICKKNKKHKKHKDKSLKKSSKKYNSKKKMDLLDRPEIIKYNEIRKKGFFERISDLFNIDTNIDIKITDESVNSAISSLFGFLLSLFVKE